MSGANPHNNLHLLLNKKKSNYVNAKRAKVLKLQQKSKNPNNKNKKTCVKNKSLQVNLQKLNYEVI